MKLVIDASVAVKWFVEEDAFAMARLMTQPRIKRIAPDLVIAEVANVLRRKTRTDGLGEVQAVAAVNSLPYFFDSLASSAELAGKGFALSQLLDHAVYDCMYLALALTEADSHLVTSDVKFINKAATAGFADKILNLEAAHARFMTGQENDNG